MQGPSKNSILEKVLISGENDVTICLKFPCRLPEGVVIVIICCLELHVHQVDGSE